MSDPSPPPTRKTGRRSSSSGQIWNPRPTTHVTALYPEIMSMIFSYLDVEGKGRVSQVCSTWRDSAYRISVWRGVEAKLHLKKPNHCPTLFPSLVQRGIKRVQVKCKLQALRESNHPNKNNASVAVAHNFTVIITDSNRTAIKVTVDVINSDGIAGLFRGLTSTMAREMPGYFFFFGGYEVSKMVLTGGHPDQAGLVQTIVAGGIGGICLWSSIFPFDVVKSRIQVESSKEKMITVLVRIGQKEGLAGLYRGLGPTLLRTFPSTGALFVAYEYSKDFMTVGANKLSLV